MIPTYGRPYIPFLTCRITYPFVSTLLDIRYIYVTINRGWYQRREYREPAEPVGGNALSGSWPDCQKPQNGKSAPSTQTYHRST